MTTEQATAARKEVLKAPEQFIKDYKRSCSIRDEKQCDLALDLLSSLPPLDCIKPGSDDKKRFNNILMRVFQPQDIRRYQYNHFLDISMRAVSEIEAPYQYLNLEADEDHP